MKERELTEKEILRKRLQLEEISIQVEALTLQANSMEGMIKVNLPERKAKSELEKIREQIESNKDNIKVLEKQIKEKKEKYLE